MRWCLTLQNGVDSVPQIEDVIGRGRVLGGATYVAAALAEPGVIEQTGVHRRVVFGETTGDVSRVSGTRGDDGHALPGG